MKNIFNELGKKLFSRKDSAPVVPEGFAATGDALCDAIDILEQQGFERTHTGLAAQAFYVSLATEHLSVTGGAHVDFSKTFNKGKNLYLVSLINSGDDKGWFIVALPDVTPKNRYVSAFPVCAKLDDFVKNVKGQTVEGFFQNLPKEVSKKIYSSCERPSPRM